MKTLDADIVLPELKFDQPIDQRVTPAMLKQMQDFEAAERAAFDQLPVSLKRAFLASGVPVVFQIIVKGLAAGEFTEDEIAAEINERARAARAAARRIDPARFRHLQ